MSKKVCVLVANGSEEMETVICVDVLRRAGLDVFLAKVGEGSGAVTASRGVNLIPDGRWDPGQAGELDALVIPGGMEGTETMQGDESVLQAVRDLAAAGKLVASICAGPLVLQDAGVLAGRKYTCYPSLKDQLTAGTWVDERVVQDGRVVTSQGPGTTFLFALKVAENLAGAETAADVAADLLLTYPN
ncbi:MAG: DJ-1 family protein [Lentisphaerae bacterium]|jgi:DJ-1 family protein|nr:DJ-1 family protein [Lentisphaerota bacterium]